MSTPQEQLTQAMTLPEFIDKVGDSLQVPKVLRDAIFERESGFQHYGQRGVKRSPKGALGVGQLLPATAARFGVDPNDPLDNAYGALKYQKELYDRYLNETGSQNTAMLLTAASYNAGEWAVAKYRGIPPYAETQAYVKFVAQRIRAASPESATEIVDEQPPSKQLKGGAASVFQTPSVPTSVGGLREKLFGAPSPEKRAAVKAAIEDFESKTPEQVNIEARLRQSSPAARYALETLLQGAAGITEAAAGSLNLLGKTSTLDPLGSQQNPLAGVSERMKQAAANMRGGGEVSKGEHPEVGKLARMTQSVLGGGIEFAPLALAPEAGIPAALESAIAFGGYSGLQSSGRGESKAQIARTVATQGALGAVVGAPSKLIPFKSSLARSASKLAVVSPAAYTLTRLNGGSPDEALEAAILFPALSGLGEVRGLMRRKGAVPEVPGAAERQASRVGQMPEIPEIPVGTISEPRVIKKGARNAGKEPIYTEAGQASEAYRAVGDEARSASIESEVNRVRNRQQAQEGQVVPLVPVETPAGILPDSARTGGADTSPSALETRAAIADSLARKNARVATGAEPEPIPAAIQDAEMKAAIADSIARKNERVAAPIESPAPRGTLEVVKRGDFYEFFGDNAKPASEILSTPITRSTQTDELLTGIPYHRVSDLLKIEDAGYALKAEPELRQELDAIRRMKSKQESAAPPPQVEPRLDPDAIIQRATALPDATQLPESAKSRPSEAGFAMNPVEIARGAVEIARNFPNQIRDFSGAFKARTKEARAGVRNVARETLRAVAEAQINPKFNAVWRGIVTAQEESAGRLYDVRHYLHDAWKPLFRAEQERVADVYYRGIESGRVYSPTELKSLGLGDREITAYQRLRQAEDTTLDMRRDQLIAKIDDAMSRINDPDQLTVLGDLKTNINNHYSKLKLQGYGSLQRIGDYVVVATDPKLPSTDPNRVHYDHEETAIGAQRRAREFRKRGLQVVRTEKLDDIPRGDYARMTPEEFEQVVASSGANPSSAEVQRIRDEIYSRFPSRGYELQRDFTLGYKRSKDSLTKSIIRQAEVYSNTYKNSLGRLRAERALIDADVAHDPGLYRYSQRFIENEVAPQPLSPIAKLAQRGRQLVYLKVLAGDIGQFYMNAVAQPMQLTYPYFARPEFGLRGVQPEVYFARGWKLAGQALTKRAPSEFQHLFERAVKEGVGQAQLTRSLAEAEIHGRSKAMELASLPMQLGERVTRGHVLAESYLVGKEKLKLRGEKLYRFMADSTYATQTRMGAGEAPGAIRMTGEIGRAAYQFQAFQQMYMENLGLSIRSDLRANVSKGQLPLSTLRFIAGTAVTAGLTGLPLAGAARIVSKAIFGDDWKKVFERLMADKPLLRDLALYGIISGGQQGASERMNAPLSNVPAVPQVSSESDLLPRVPVLSTAGDLLIRAPSDLYRGDYVRAGEDVAPRILKGPLRAYRYDTEGIRTRGHSMIASRKALTLKDKLLTIFNVSTAKETQYYEKHKMQQADRAIRSVRRMSRRAVRKVERMVPEVPTQTSPP